MNTTHIGSLPYLSVDEAVQFNNHITLPCLPTLPKLFANEWMLNQFLCGFMLEEHVLPFCCADEFFKKYKGRVKIQLCGIQTLFNNIPYPVEKSNFVSWYTKTVRRFLDTIENEFVLFFDEPDLRSLDIELWKVYSQFNLKDQGIHSCAKGDWKKFDLSSFNHISFDSRLISSTEIDHLRKNNKILYFGDLDTKSGDSFNSIIKESDFLTPSCGLALNDLSSVLKIQNQLIF